MRLVFAVFGEIARTLCPVVFALRTRARATRCGARHPLAALAPVQVVEPLSIFAALSMQKRGGGADRQRLHLGGGLHPGHAGA